MKKIRLHEECPDSGHAPIVTTFEQAFAAVVRTREAVATSSGSTALNLAYRHIFPKGKQVIVPAFGFAATVLQLVEVGLVPVFADINETLNLDPEEIERLVTPDVGGVVHVPLYGNPATLKATHAMCQKYGLKLIVDGAQAHTALTDGKHLIDYADAVTYSFYSSKNLATGEGGAVVSQDEELIGAIRHWQRQGQIRKYVHTDGGNFRMHPAAAQIGLDALPDLAFMTTLRQRNARWYADALNGSVNIPRAAQGHVYHLFTILAHPDKREKLAAGLSSVKVEVGLAYSKPLHTQPALKKYKTEELPHTEQAAARCLNIPVHPHLTRAEVEYVAAALCRIWETL